jgi:hypothetical protein
MRYMYILKDKLIALFHKASIYMLRHCYFVYNSCCMRHFYIVIILYVNFNHLDILISSDVLCMSSIIYFPLQGYKL